ncbi:MAG: Fic family protein [Candidatus Thermoplasmatota archaeon]|nr:Fic family protein [Candidatus Thermoplasmatota archaeon]
MKILSDTDISMDTGLLESINNKKEELDLKRPLPQDVLKNLLEDIRIRHTYDSNAIEGNTLTLAETKLVIEEGITIGGKPLKDHLEAKNNAEAFGLLLQLAKSKAAINHETIQKLHFLVTQGILDDAGKYRTKNVRIQGSSYTPPDFSKIIGLMDEYISAIKASKIHPVKAAVFAHYEFVKIHPFTDGNGRLARLLMNLYLMNHGYPPTVLHQGDRKKYYETLHKADTGNIEPFANFIGKAIKEYLISFLSAFGGEYELIPLKELVEYSPYSHDYLGLRARQGVLDSVKINGKWHSSKKALKDYYKKYR